MDISATSAVHVLNIDIRISIFNRVETDIQYMFYIGHGTIYCTSDFPNLKSFCQPRR